MPPSLLAAAIGGLPALLHAQQAAPPADAAATATATATASAATLVAAAAQTRVADSGVQSVTIEGTDESGGYQATSAAVAKGVQSLRDIPQSVTVVNRALMDAQGARSLTDALRNVPGITLGGAEGGQIGNNINLRGFTARTDIYLDGMRDRGQYYRDVFFLDEIEVLEGPSSMLFGRGSTGGVIDQVSKLPHAQPISEATLQVDSAGSARTTLDLGRPLSEGAAFRIAAMAQDAKSTRDTLHNRDAGLAPSLTVGQGTPTQLTVSALLLHNDDMPDYGIPPLNGRPAPVSYKTDYGLSDDHTVQNVGMLSVLAAHRFDDGATELRNQARAVHYGTRARETGASRVGTWDGSTFKTLATSATGYGTSLPVDQLWVLLGSHDRDIDDNGFYDQVDLTTTVRTGRFAHALLAGLDLAHDEYSNQGYSRVDPGIGGATGVAVVPLGGAVAIATPLGITRTTGNLAQSHANSIGIYLNDTIELSPQWKLVAGLRRDRFEAGITNSVNSANTAGNTALAVASQVAAFTSVRAGAIWQPTPRQSVYVSYGTSFDPSLETLTLTTGQQELSPEHTRSVEAGSKLDLQDGRLSLNGAVFRIEKDNSRSQVSPGVWSVDGNVRVDGIELGAAGRLTRTWQVVAGYTWLDGSVIRASSLDGTQGKTLANTPRHSATLWTTWNATPQWEIGGGAVATSGRWASNTNVVAAPGFVRLDATLAWHQPAYDVRLNVFNVGDVRYIAGVQASDGGRSVPGAGRTAQITGTWRF